MPFMFISSAGFGKKYSLSVIPVMNAIKKNTVFIEYPFEKHLRIE
jgi:hypothetical protein